MSAPKPPAMLVFIDAYRGGTEGMPSKFRGPYFDLLCALFDAGGDILNKPDVLARAARIEPRSFKTFWSEWSHKFVITGDRISHHKVDEQLLKYSKKVAVLQQNGRKGGKKTQTKQRKSKANAKATQPNGLGTPSYEGSSLTLAPEGAAALEVLRATCAESGHQTAELSKLQTALTGYENGKLFVGDLWTRDTFTERLGPQLRAAKLELAVQRAPVESKSPNLTAIAGGKS